MTWSFAGRASRAAFVQPLVEISKQLASDWSAAGPGYVTIADYPGDLRQYKVSVLFADTRRFFLRLNSTCPPFEPEP